MNRTEVQLPVPTPAQVDFARKISMRLRQEIPPDDMKDRQALSNWIGAHQAAFKSATYARSKSLGATSKQVAFAERIAGRKRRDIPDECFRDAGLMSRWIDRNR